MRAVSLWLVPLALYPVGATAQDARYSMIGGDDLPARYHHPAVGDVRVIRRSLATYLLTGDAAEIEDTWVIKVPPEQRPAIQRNTRHDEWAFLPLRGRLNVWDAKIAYFRASLPAVENLVRTSLVFHYFNLGAPNRLAAAPVSSAWDPEEVDWASRPTHSEVTHVTPLSSEEGSARIDFGNARSLDIALFLLEEGWCHLYSSEAEDPALRPVVLLEFDPLPRAQRATVATLAGRPRALGWIAGRGFVASAPSGTVNDVDVQWKPAADHGEFTWLEEMVARDVDNQANDEVLVVRGGDRALVTFRVVSLPDGRVRLEAVTAHAQASSHVQERARAPESTRSWHAQTPVGLGALDR